VLRWEPCEDMAAHPAAAPLDSATRAKRTVISQTRPVGLQSNLTVPPRGPSDGAVTPSTLTRLVSGLPEAFAADIRMRVAEEGIDTAATEIETHDFQGDGVVFEEAGVTVTAFVANQARAVPSGEARLALDKALGRMGVLASVHELSHRAAADAEAVEVTALLERLLDALRSSALSAGGRIRLRVHAEEKVFLPVDIAVPLALAASEAVINACKHAVPDGQTGRRARSRSDLSGGRTEGCSWRFRTMARAWPFRHVRTACV
jgi:hypothetical protein